MWWQLHMASDQRSSACALELMKSPSKTVSPHRYRESRLSLPPSLMRLLFRPFLSPTESHLASSYPTPCYIEYSSLLPRTIWPSSVALMGFQ